MKKLILIRHGDYSGDKLNEVGRKQIIDLTNVLKEEYLNDESILLMTSTALRASDSAKVVSEILKIDYKEYKTLWSDKNHKENHEALLELIKSKQNEAETIILVTHYEYVEEFPAYFASKELDIEWSDKLIGKGEAWVIDCQAKTREHVQI